MYNCVIFEGGGVRGIAYVGAVRRLDELNVLKHVKKFGGSSAGSQVAALLAAGYNSKELEEVLLNTPLDEFKDGSCGCCRDMYRFFNQYGYYKGDFMREYFDSLMERKLGKKGATFRELFSKRGTHLRITGTCVTTQKLEIFDHLKTPDMPVSLAMHISSCIPLFFKPVTYNNKTYVDGGCLRNLPTNLFDCDGELDHCLVFEVTSDVGETRGPIKGFRNFCFGLMNTVHSAANKVDVEQDLFEIIGINTGEVSAFDFELEKEVEQRLIKEGYETTSEKLENIVFV
jgi:predicted acylesterase/phospholipase RssA